MRMNLRTILGRFFYLSNAFILMYIFYFNVNTIINVKCLHVSIFQMLRT